MLLVLISQNLKRSLDVDHATRHFVIPKQILNSANQCTKFQVSRFSHFRDIVGGAKNLQLVMWL